MKIKFYTGHKLKNRRLVKTIGVCVNPVKDLEQKDCPCDISQETTQTVFLTNIKLPIDPLCNIEICK